MGPSVFFMGLSFPWNKFSSSSTSPFFTGDCSPLRSTAAHYFSYFSSNSIFFACSSFSSTLTACTFIVGCFLTSSFFFPPSTSFLSSFPTTPCLPLSSNFFASTLSFPATLSSTVPFLGSFLVSYFFTGDSFFCVGCFFGGDGLTTSSSSGSSSISSSISSSYSSSPYSSSSGLCVFSFFKVFSFFGDWFACFCYYSFC